MTQFELLARGNEEINKWLGEHPLVLGLMFLVIGLAVGGWGLWELSTGTAHGKYGKAIGGTQAKVLAIIRIVAGVGCILFAAFKVLFG